MGNTSPCPVCGAPVAYDENFDEYEQPDEEEKEVIDEDCED